MLGAHAAQNGDAGDKAAAKSQTVVMGASQEKAQIAEQIPSYPFDSCLVTGEKFSAEAPAVDFIVDGHLIRACCKSCVKPYKKDPAVAVAKIYPAAAPETAK